MISIRTIGMASLSALLANGPPALAEPGILAEGLVQTVPAAPRLDPGLPGDGATPGRNFRRRTYGAIAELGPEILSGLDRYATRLEAERAWDAMRPQIDALLPWLGGQGVLMEVQIVRQRAPTDGPTQTRFGHLHLAGIGNSPTSVVTASRRPPSIVPGSNAPVPTVPATIGLDRSSWIVSDSDSYFLWITMEQDGLAVQEYPGLAYRELSVRRALAHARTMVDATLSTREEIDRLVALERSVRLAPITEEARYRATETLRNARQSREKLAEIRERMAISMRRAERVAAMLAMLDRLDGALSVADKARALHASFGSEVPAEALTAQSHEVLYQRVVREQVSLDGQQVRMRQEIQTIQRDVESSNVRVRTIERELSIPAPVRLP